MALDWDDLRYVYAVALHGSLAAAGRALGVNHTTVLRRVQAFEQQLGYPVFERRPGGYAPVAAVAPLIAGAAAIDAAVRALEADLAGGDLKLDGIVRIACADILVDALSAHLAALRLLHPKIVVELVDGAADVTVAATGSPPPALVGRRIARLGFAFYAAPAYVAASPVDPQAPFAHPMLMPGPGVEGGAWWCDRLPPEMDAAVLAPSFVALASVARAALGVALLPCLLGDAAPLLTRLWRPAEQPRIDVWVLTHDRLRRTARVRAVMEHIGRGLDGERKRLEGAA